MKYVEQITRWRAVPIAIGIWSLSFGLTRLNSTFVGSENIIQRNLQLYSSNNEKRTRLLDRPPSGVYSPRTERFN